MLGLVKISKGQKIPSRIGLGFAAEAKNRKKKAPHPLIFVKENLGLDGGVGVQWLEIRNK